MSPEGDELTFSHATTRAEARALLARHFFEAGVEHPNREAALLLRCATGLSSAALITTPDARLGSAAERVELFARRRAAREPLSRIEGRRSFWRHDFRVSPAVLDPRPETEILVQAALTEASRDAKSTLRVLDLGVGSGAILCALLAEWPRATGLGIDASPDAAEIARYNAVTLGLQDRARMEVGHWGESLSGLFDVIVSNPPYIVTAEIADLDPEVRAYDPHLALDGGADGLDAYRALAPDLTRLLAEGGRFFLEIGAGQALAVRNILAAQDLHVLKTTPDLAGVLRVVCGCRKADLVKSGSEIRAA